MILEIKKNKNIKDEKRFEIAKQTVINYMQFVSNGFTAEYLVDIALFIFDFLNDEEKKNFDKEKFNSFFQFEECRTLDFKFLNLKQYNKCSDDSTKKIFNEYFGYNKKNINYCNNNIIEVGIVYFKLEKFIDKDDFSKTLFDFLDIVNKYCDYKTFVDDLQKIQKWLDCYTFKFKSSLFSRKKNVIKITTKNETKKINLKFQFSPSLISFF